MSQAVLCSHCLTTTAELVRQPGKPQFCWWCTIIPGTSYLLPWDSIPQPRKPPVILSIIMAKNKSTVRYSTVPYGTAGDIWGRVVPYGTNCARKYILQRLSVTSTRTISVSNYPARWRLEYAKYWLISLIVKTCLGRVTIDMAT